MTRATRWTLEIVNSREPENLEKLMTEALRGLPPRRAPLDLESRVLGELRRRAA